MADLFSDKLSTFHKLLIPLFDVGYVYLVQTPEEWEELFLAIEQPCSVSGHLGHSSYIQSEDTGEWIFVLGIFEEHIPTLAHEAAHITFYILNVVGEQVSVDQSNETFCYLLGAIVDWATTALEVTKQDAAIPNQL